jgi:hypothetical protein
MPMFNLLKDEVALAVSKAGGDEANCGRSLQEVMGADIGQLKARWRELTGVEPPDFRSEKLRRALAYLIQVQTHGGLSTREQKELKRWASRREANQKQAPASGTKLLRSWAGEVHEVLVVEDGYRWRDQTWPSLTRIALEITGTKWNGPAFFGLRTKPGAEA